MKFKLIALASVVSIAIMGTALASVPFLSLHRHNSSNGNDYGKILFNINADSSIPDTNRLHAVVSGYEIAQGQRVPLLGTPFSTELSRNWSASIGTDLAVLKRDNVSTIVVTLLTANGTQIPNCVATLSSGSDRPISTPATRTLTVRKTGTGYRCSVN